MKRGGKQFSHNEDEARDAFAGGHQRKELEASHVGGEEGEGVQESRQRGKKRTASPLQVTSSPGKDLPARITKANSKGLAGEEAAESLLGGGGKAAQRRSGGREENIGQEYGLLSA